MKIEKLPQKLRQTTAEIAAVDDTTTAEIAAVTPELPQKLRQIWAISGLNCRRNCVPFKDYQGGWGFQGCAVAPAPALLGRSAPRRPVENHIGPTTNGAKTTAAGGHESEWAIACACWALLRDLGPACRVVAEICLRAPGAFYAACVNVADQRYLARFTADSLSPHAGKPSAVAPEFLARIREQSRYWDASGMRTQCDRIARASGNACHAPVRVSGSIAGFPAISPTRDSDASVTRDQASTGSPLQGPSKPHAPRMRCACCEHQTSTRPAPCSTVAHRELPQLAHRCGRRTPEPDSPRTVFAPHARGPNGSAPSGHTDAPKLWMHDRISSAHLPSDCQSRQPAGRASTGQDCTGGGPGIAKSCRAPGVVWSRGGGPATGAPRS